MLTAATVSSAKPALKAYKISDGRSLHLRVMTNGSRLWRLKYRVDMDGRRAEKLLSLGPYPRISHAQARAAAEAVRVSLRTDLRRATPD